MVEETKPKDGKYAGGWKNDYKGGHYTRQATVYRNIISPDSKNYKPESGRYHLIISWACPWANSCAMVREMKGLQKVISLSVVHPTW